MKTHEVIKDWKILKWVLSFIKPYTFKIMIATFWAVLMVILPMQVPMIIGYLVDLLGGKAGNMYGITLHGFNSGQQLLLVFGVLLLVALLEGVVVYFRRTSMARVTHHFLLDLRREFYRHLQWLSMDFHHHNSTGDLISRVTGDMNKIQPFIRTILVRTFMNIARLAYPIVMLSLISPKLALAALSVIPFYWFGYFILRSRLRKISREIRKQRSLLTNVLEERLGGIELIKAFAREDTEEQTFTETANEETVKRIKRARLNANLQSIAHILTGIGLAVTWWLGAKLVLEGTMSLGRLVEFTGLLGFLYGPVRRLAEVGGVYQTFMAAAERIFEIFNRKPEIIDKPDAKELPKEPGRVEFRHVNFAYSGREEILNDVTFTAEPGEIISLVGPSGSGKSTIARLLTRLYDAPGGQVLINGHDVRAVTLNSLREQIGIVSQEVIIFSGTVEDAIRYGRPDATFRELKNAAQKAYAHEFIMDLPDGYQTQLGPEGIQLSGGQRQRIAIARVFLRDPKILILDEATSALDAQSQYFVVRALEELKQGRTTFIIAHNFSANVLADRILVVKSGRIVESGTHEELLYQDGLYAQLYEKQAYSKKNTTRENPWIN